MPVDVTENFIHFRVRDPSLFSEIRLTDFDGKLPKGIRAKYGKKKGSSEWAIQAYLFDKSFWTLDEARSWVEKHREAKRQGAVTYVGSAKPERQEGEDLVVKTYIFDSDLCQNDWGITPEGRKSTLDSLLSTRLLGPAPPGEVGRISGGPKGSPHEGNWYDYGDFTDYISNGVTFGFARTSHPYAKEQFKSGAWKAVSPSISPILENTVDGVTTVHKAEFDHVLIVGNPAFPQAGAKSDVTDFCNFTASFQASLKPSQGGNVLEKIRDIIQAHFVKSEGSSLPLGTQEPDTKQKGGINMKPEGIPDPIGSALPTEVVATATTASPPAPSPTLPSLTAPAKQMEKTSPSVTPEELQALKKEVDALKVERQAEKDLIHAGKVQEASKLFQASASKDEKVKKTLIDKLQAMTTKDLETLMELVPTTNIKQGAGVAGIPGVSVGVPLESTPVTGEGPRTVSLGRWNPTKKEWEDEK